MTTVGRVERTKVETDSMDRSFELIRALYAPITPERPQPTERFRFGVDGAGVEGVRVDRLIHSSGYRMVADPTGFVGIVTLLRGCAHYEAAGREVRATRSQTFAFPGDTSVQVQHSGYDLRLVTLPVARLAERAREITGRPDFTLHVDLSRLGSGTDEDRWRATVDLVEDELRRPDASTGGSLLRANALALLVDVALAMFPNSTHTVLPAPSRWEAPSVRRRAEEYVEANAFRTLGVAEIAAAVGVETSALRDAFARHGEVSLTGHLRRIRLQRAGEELQCLDGPDRAAATEIVQRWGFATPERFARLYHQNLGIRLDQIWSG